MQNRAPLAPSAFQLLPLGAVKPRGWLRRQLELQARGMGGRLDEFWPDLGPNSGWLGGDGESWERGPYFTDGLIPLAFLLDDPALVAKAGKWVAWTLASQRPDGAIGPVKNTDWWPNMVMLKALAQYQEATGDPRVIPLLERYFAYHARHAGDRPLKEWAVYRWADELVTVLWLYNRNGDPRLLDLARQLRVQGFDWKAHFSPLRFTEKVTREEIGLVGEVKNTDTALSVHGVNNAMALKTTTLWSLVSGDETDRTAVYRQLEQLDRHHLLPNGMHAADEHYAGRDPSQGVELCAVVEAMFSLEHVLAVLGDAALGDRLERIAFNALPGTFTGDMWAHQYDQQANQVRCTVEPRQWVSNGPEANIFGLEPNFGCCTANFHQGWPKLAASLWMASADQGLVAAAWAPSEVRTIVGDVPLTIVEETEYPFRGSVRLDVTPDAPVAFPLRLRIPAWADGASVRVNGRAESGVRPGTFHRVERTWRAGDRVEVAFPLAVRASRWHRNSVALERGPLVFSLKIGEDWRKLRDRPPTADWEVHPTTPWNYALVPDAARQARVIEKPVGPLPFTPAGAPVELRVRGRQLPGWTLSQGSAGPLPESPVESAEPDEELTLIPYGSAKLRVTAFPEAAARR